MKTSKITKYQDLSSKIEKFESENYGYQLTEAKQNKLDKMYSDKDKLVRSMNEDELWELEIDPEMI